YCSRLLPRATPMWRLPLWSMASDHKLRSLRISEARLVVRQGAFKWVLAGSVALCLLGAQSCLIPFDDYPEGDVCDAGRDAGVRLSTAPDPVLRGCDAGPEPEPEVNEEAAGAGGSP
ncbi:MAG: hypothetical protein ABW061_05770, partial [Polyangiaceae bacterium]